MLGDPSSRRLRPRRRLSCRLSCRRLLCLPCRRPRPLFPYRRLCLLFLLTFRRPRPSEEGLQDRILRYQGQLALQECQPFGTSCSGGGSIIIV